ncbi:MAG: O-antigen ligase family protein [bacterium]|nr:O-antigen ligase family protein [bacterium]
MSPYETTETPAERKLTAPLLAGAGMALAAAGTLWAHSIGTLAMKAAMFSAAAGAVALVLWEPLIGLCLMAFLIPVESVYTFAGGWIAITRIAGVLTFTSLLFKAQLREGLLRFDGGSKWILLFAAWIAVSCLWAKEKSPAFVMALTVGQLALFWVLLRAMLRSPDELRWVCFYFIGGTALAILVSALMPKWDLAPRLIYLTGNPNHLARDIAIGLILLTYYAPAARPTGKALAVAVGGFLVLGLALTQSRAGWLATAIPLLIYGIGSRKVTPLIIVFAMGSLALLLFSVQLLTVHLGVTSADVEIRGESIVDPAAIRSSRADIWRAGIILGSRHPIVGVGAGSFVESVPEAIAEMQSYTAMRNIEAHNTFITAFAELGIVGLILLLGILWQCARFIARQPYSLEKIVAWSLLVSVLIRMMFGTVCFQKTTWLALGLSQILAARGTAKTEAAGGDAAAESGTVEA